MLDVGIFAPNFKLQGSDGKEHTRKEFEGKYLVLYFYPKDNTPGCTMEAKEFTKYLPEFDSVGANVVGVSRDDTKSHEHFVESCKLGILLLSDLTRNMIQAYGAWGDKGIFGMGVLRKTFVLDPTGKIIKIYPKVSPAGHAKEVLEFIKAAKNGGQV